MMNSLDIIASAIKFVKEELKNAEGGHDWWHIKRVFNTSVKLAEKENADLLVVKLAALLHDIADSKFNEGNELLGPQKARSFLTELAVDNLIIDHVVAIIENISFKGGKNNSTVNSIEFQIVQDADRLDALGAIGIARAFNYGGFKNRELYNPNIPPNLNMSKEEYKNSTAPTINHFYEKLFLLKDRMNTSSGKKLAQKRHEFMEQFIDQFYTEWEGNI